MLELLFLLLPVAAAYGWYMGRRNAQQTKQDEANRLSREYVAGVNLLLSNQQDKAVDLFLDMLKEDTGTVEAHLTLGNLFRSRGEVDRAIRIHQTLMESASLSYDQRLLAVQQLGRDYMAAGMYDRAEDMFNQLNDIEAVWRKQYSDQVNQWGGFGMYPCTVGSASKKTVAKAHLTDPQQVLDTLGLLVGDVSLFQSAGTVDLDSRGHVKHSDSSIRSEQAGARYAMKRQQSYKN